MTRSTVSKYNDKYPIQYVTASNIDKAIEDLKRDIALNTSASGSSLLSLWNDKSKGLGLHPFETLSPEKKLLYFHGLHYFWCTWQNSAKAGSLYVCSGPSSDLKKLIKETFPTIQQSMAVDHKHTMTASNTPPPTSSAVTIKSFANLNLRSITVAPKPTMTTPKVTMTPLSVRPVEPKATSQAEKIQHLEKVVASLTVRIETVENDNKKINAELDKIIIKNILDEKENKAYEQDMYRIYSSEQLLDFYDSLKEKLDTRLLAFQALRSELIQHTDKANSAISFFAALATLPLAALGSIVDKTANRIYSSSELKGMKNSNLILGNIIETCKLVEEFSRRLTIVYADQIKLLTDEGARKAAKEYVASIVIEALKMPNMIPRYDTYNKKLESLYDCITQHTARFYKWKNTDLPSDVIEKATAQGMFVRCAIGVKKRALGNDALATVSMEYKDEKIICIDNTVWSVFIDGKKSSKAGEPIVFKYGCREELYKGEIDKMKLKLEFTNSSTSANRDHKEPSPLKRRATHRRRSAIGDGDMSSSTFSPTNATAGAGGLFSSTTNADGMAAASAGQPIVRQKLHAS